MGQIGQGVTLNGFFHEDAQYTWLLAAAIVAANVGSAVSGVAGTANTVKLAADGERIYGRLETYEDRKVEGMKTGTVNTNAGVIFPLKAADAMAPGDTAVGGGAGTVRKALTADGFSNWVCAEKLSGNRVVLVKL